MQLTYLLLLLCPISMGAMMWFMMRGHGAPSKQPVDPRIADLESQVNELRSSIQDRSRESANTLK